MKIKLQKKNGFTIVEVLISLAVFAVIVIPISLILMQGVTTNKKAEQKQQAMMIAQNIFETLKGYSEEQFVDLKTLTVRGQTVSKNGDDLLGVVDGYEITGYIKAVDGYEFKTQKMDMDEEKAFKITNSVGKFNEASNIREVDVIKEKSGEISIGGGPPRIKDLKEPIYLIITKECEDKMRFNMQNKSEIEELIYIIKKEDSQASYEINNIGGVFNIISDIVIPSKESENIKKLYEIYIKASKNGNFFEVNSYKNIK